MSVFKPRTRLVNFRLSEEEFAKLRSLCPLHGARSISDFARSSVLDRLERTPVEAVEPAMGAAPQLDNKVNALESRVDQLVSLLNAVGFTAPGVGSGMGARVELPRPQAEM